MDASPVALILAAGLGTRMKSGRAKVLHEVAGRPMIVWAVLAARAAGAGRVVVVLGHQSDAVRAVLDERFGPGAVEVALQSEQRGTGHAVLSALPVLADESPERIALITSGDAPLLRAERLSALVTACQGASARMALLSTRPTRPAAYGRLLRDERGVLRAIVEHADASESQRQIQEMNAGFYAIALGPLRSEIATLRADNAQGEIYLTDLAARAYAGGGAAVCEAPFEEVSGVNDRADLAAVDAIARRDINEALMRAGVTMVAPAQTFIDADVGPIGRDVWIGPGVCLRGRTRVGDRVRIDAGCVLSDVEVADGVVLRPYSVLSEAVVGQDAQVGPFSHCRPGTRIDENARLGNFVETKNAHLMAGAKASHLAYLGDASIGAGANVGAGTITCNYDGMRKHRTVIEAGAFIGSDTQLVAPVTVGRDAYVGSGTTVTKDVPRGALALSRSKQVNIEGWAERFREAQQKRERRGNDGTE